MDPLTAALSAYAATLEYAVKVRDTMSQEHRDKWDALFLQNAEWWQRLFTKLAGLNEGSRP